MSKHGTAYIAQVDDLAASSEKFARMVTGCWQHLMGDGICARIQIIQNGVERTINNR